VGAVRARAGSLVRRRVGATVLLALLVGLAGAVSLAALAGARRGERALPRFLARQDPPAAVVYAFGPGPGPGSVDDGSQTADAIRELPGVEQATRVAPLLVAGPDVAGTPRRLVALDQIDGGGTTVLGRPIVVAGRAPDGTRPDEVAVDEEFVDRTGIEVGERFPLRTYTAARTGDTDPNGAPPDGPTVEVRVVGVVRHPHDLVPARLEQDTTGVDGTDVYLTPAFWEEQGPDLATFFGVGVAVRLERGADVARFEAAVDRAFEGSAFTDVVDPEQGFAGISLAGVRRAIDLETRALQGFAAVAGLAGLVLVGQALARQAAADAADDPVLDALGMTRGQRVAAATMRAAVPAVGGAALAVLGAVALSPLLPVGVARRAEVDPGVDVDATVLSLGALAVVALVCGWAAVAAGRAAAGARQEGGPVRPSLLARVAAGSRLPVAGWAGLTMAARRGRGGTSGLRRTAMAATGVTIAVVVAAVAFTTSLDRATEDPEGYGVSWDVSVGQPGDPDQAAAVAERLGREEGVTAFTGFTGEGLRVGDDPEVPAMVVFDGRVSPPVVEGRAPRGPDEIAFAGHTLEDLGLEVGDRVDVGIDSSRSLRVTGEVLLNGAGLLDDVEDGEGALLPDPAQQLLVPPDDGALSFPGGYLVRLAPDADREAVIERLERAFPRTVVRPLPPSQVDNLERVGRLPTLLAGLVALLGAGTIVHATATTVRRRRRDLGVLAGLGFVRRQVSATMAWQATAIAVLALVVGLPVGVAAGRWVWRLTADALWVIAPPEVPWLAVALVAGAALVVVNGAALGAAARRGPPAAALRAE
jgi:hypothetical protein